MVGIELNEVDDDALRLLGAIPGLRSLKVPFCNITDAGLLYIGKIRGLEELDLIDAILSDDGLEAPASLTRLQILDLRGVDIDGSGLAFLRGLHWLRELRSVGDATRRRQSSTSGRIPRSKTPEPARHGGWRLRPQDPSGFAVTWKTCTSSARRSPRGGLRPLANSGSTS